MDIHDLAELERQKLILEIRQLKRPFIFSSNFVAASAPIVIALLTVVAGILTGFFDETKARLQERNQELTAKLADMEREYALASSQLEEKEETLAATGAAIDESVETLDQLQTEAVRLNTGLATLIDQKQELARTLSSIDTSKLLPNDRQAVTNAAATLRNIEAQKVQIDPAILKRSEAIRASPQRFVRPNRETQK